MKAAHFGTVVAMVAGMAFSTPVMAQSDILLQLRSGSPAADRLRVDSAGSVVALSRLGYGIMPASGPGERMMWHGFKAAFRAGGTDGNDFDEANVGFYSLAGGRNNVASALGTFAVGEDHVVSGALGSALGSNNRVSGGAGFAAGASNTCTGSYCVAIGFSAAAIGQGAVSIGFRTTADAEYSLALGTRASTNGRSGAMVMADNSTTDSLEASANNQFSVRAAGGYRLFTNATMTTGVSLSAGGGAWNVMSDRNRKENFAGITGEDILTRLRFVPVSTWNYIGEDASETRHIGPMAQDWQAAFGLSDDETTINSGDMDGVLLAAVKGLDARTDGMRSTIESLGAELRSLRAEAATLRADNVSMKQEMDSAKAEMAAQRALMMELQKRLQQVESAARVNQ